MPASCFSNQQRSVNSSASSCSASASLPDNHQSTFTTPDERARLRQRFVSEGIDPSISDVKKLPYVWQWLNDAECNCLSLRKQIEKLHRQQEIDLREVENYVNHVWQVSSDKIKSLEKECHSLQYQLNCHRANGCLYNCTDVASNFIHESFTERSGIRSFFRRGKSKSKDKINPTGITTPLSENDKIVRSIEQDNDADDTSANITTVTNVHHDDSVDKMFQRQNTNIVHRQCDCVEITNENIVNKLQNTIRELQVENVNLTSKLSQLLRVCTLLRSKLREKYQQSQVDEKVTSSPVLKTNYTVSDNINRSYEDKSCQTSNLYINSLITSNGGSSGSEKNTLNSTDTGIYSTISSAIDNNHITSSTVTNDTTRIEEEKIIKEKDDIIYQLRDEMKKLEKQINSKDAAYTDLVKKYEMRKQLHTETVTRLREHIDRENRKWQQLFQAANLRKRQALAQLSHHRSSALASSSQMDIGYT